MTTRPHPAPAGVPSLYTDSDVDHVEHGEEWTLARRGDYVSHRYHKPSDEFDPARDLTGAIDDLELLFRVGYRLAATADWPNWREKNGQYLTNNSQQPTTASISS